MSSQSNIKWLLENLVLAIHEAQIAEHGGVPGVRDLGLVASALARPQNSKAYSDVGIPVLAALYALGIIKNHPFLDGNRRTGAVLMEVFLDDHGFALGATDESLCETVVALAASEISEQEFTAWVEEQVRPCE